MLETWDGTTGGKTNRIGKRKEEAVSTKDVS